MHPLEAIRWREVYSNKESEKKIHTCHYAEMLYSKLQIDKVYLISYFFINLEVYMLQSGKVRVSVLNSLGA